MEQELEKDLNLDKSKGEDVNVNFNDKKIQIILYYQPPNKTDHFSDINKAKLWRDTKIAQVKQRLGYDPTTNEQLLSGISICSLFFRHNQFSLTSSPSNYNSIDDKIIILSFVMYKSGFLHCQVPLKSNELYCKDN